MNIPNPSIPLNRKKSTDQLIQQVFNQLSCSFRKEEIEQLARQTKLIERSSSKITGSDFLVSFLASICYRSHCTLERMAEMMMRVSNKIRISAQALMKRVNTNKAVRFLESIYLKLLNEKLDVFPKVPAELLAYFDKVLIQDSSVMILHETLQEHFKGSGGRASKASAKLDVIYDWKSKKYEQVILTDQREADQKLSL